MTAWHLALLPAVVAINYVVLVARHEAAHALTVLAFGAEIAELHVWPPRGGNLSWITFRLPLGTPEAAVQLQAAAPYVAALALLAVGLYLVVRLEPGLLRANVIVSAVLFPCAELALNAFAYWRGGGDLYYAFASNAWLLRIAIAALTAAALAASLGIVGRRLLEVQPAAAATALEEAFGGSARPGH